MIKPKIKNTIIENIDPESTLSKEEKELYNSLVTYKDIVYKTVGGKDLTLDILMPDESPYENIPVVVFAHGGSWTKGEKSQLVSKTRGDTTEKLLKEGYAIASIEYSLLDGDIIFPQNIEDVKDSIRWIRKNGDTYNFDTENIGLWGTSAGAHLALMSAYSDEDEFLGDEKLSEYSSKVNYVVDINGPVYLTQLINLIPEDEISKIGYQLFGIKNIGKELTKEQIDEIDKYSPIKYINDKTVDTLIFHGTKDSVVPISQSYLLYDELIDANRQAKLVVIEGAEHGLTPISDEDLQMVSEETINFIKAQYIPK